MIILKILQQSLNTGETNIVECPIPKVTDNNLLIQVQSGIVSAGTERMLVEFGNSNYYQKARQQPEKVKQVIEKVKTDGIKPTVNAVKSKLDQPITLGYSNAGIVIKVGKNVKDFKVGDRVISNGPHAEVVSVPSNLCARIPNNVSFDEAAFAVISSIGLQGIRLAKPTLGETFVVTGLGLIGLITAQLLRAHGCKVIASDFDDKKVKLAKKFGIDAVNITSGLNLVNYVHTRTDGRGADGVIITASTKSSDPISQAANMSRKRGRIILVGVTGLELNRSEFYEKELSFQVSCSYGPGRYDKNYEEKNQDYPIGFIRWTEQRNFEAVLDMMADGKLDVKSLISHSFQFEEAVKAYVLLQENRDAVGILLKYEKEAIDIKKESTLFLVGIPQIKKDMPVIGMIGAGNYTNQTLLPAMKELDTLNHTIVSNGGINGVTVGKKFGFHKTSTEINDVFKEEEINSIIITTRHDSHAELVINGLKNKKNIFVEKPLCLTREELYEIKNIEHNQILMVGFNRRFSPHVVKMKELLFSTNEAKAIIITINAGQIPSDHWTQDLATGGGRIIGEACHFIDLARYLADSSIIEVNAINLNLKGREGLEENVSISLAFENGSMATINYLANGDKSFPKERIEVFVENKILSLDNFILLKGYGWSNFSKFKTRSQNKGHANGIRAFIDSVQSGTPAIPINEVFEVTEATFKVIDQIR